MDWDKTFSEAHLYSWPTAGLSIQNTKPPHETSRNMFKDDEREIMKAAMKHGYRILFPSDVKDPRKLKVVTFFKNG